MKLHIDTPPRDTAALYSWLYRLSQDLNAALNGLDGDNLSPALAGEITHGAAAAAEAKSAAAASDRQLKSLIVKTASSVEKELQELETRLTSLYVAKSEWGTYRESLLSDARATAHGVVTEYGYESTLTELIDGVRELEKSRVESAGYIRQGVVSYDENGAPVLGIAIGQSVRVTGASETVEGQPYSVIAPGQSLGVYTSRGLSFFQCGAEVASLRDRRLIVTDARVTGTLQIGGWLWEQDPVTGLTLKWGGMI